MHCDICISRGYDQHIPSVHSNATSYDTWGVHDRTEDVIMGSARDVTPKTKKSERSGKDLAQYSEEQQNELVAAAYARELAREQRKTLEESYENSRRVEAIEENIRDTKRAKLTENVALLLAGIAMVCAIFGIVLGLEHLVQLVIPLGGGAIGAAGYKAAIGDRLVARQNQMKKNGFF